MEKVFIKYSENLNLIKEDHHICLSKCTNKLNFPSEELTCYDKCEENYTNKLEDLKIRLYNDIKTLNKSI
jgi:hypothetical protein